MEKQRLLIMDDDEEMSEEMKDLLIAEGYHVDVEHDGIKGLELIRSGSYDLVMLDLKLPNLTGYEVLECVKREQPLLKVMVISGSPIAKDFMVGELFPLLGLADAVINKPFDVNIVIRKVCDLTGERK